MRHTLIPVAALLAGLAAAPALAAPGFATGNVNLRAGPGTNYPQVVVVPAGAGVEIFGCLQGYSWCDVGFGGTRGWVSSNYLQYLHDERRVPLPQYAPQAGVPVVTFRFGDYWRDNYRGRSWYAERDRWGGGPRPAYGAPPPPPPGWQGGPDGRRDRDARPDWRDERRGPEGDRWGDRRDDRRGDRREDWREGRPDGRQDGFQNGFQNGRDGRREDGPPQGEFRREGGPDRRDGPREAGQDRQDDRRGPGPGPGAGPGSDWRGDRRTDRPGPPGEGRGRPE